MTIFSSESRIFMLIINKYLKITAGIEEIFTQCGPRATFARKIGKQLKKKLPTPASQLNVLKNIDYFKFFRVCFKR